MERPRLKAHLVPVRSGADATFFLTEHASHLLTGAPERSVLDQLDGTRTVTEIALASGRIHPLPAVMTALQKYARIGLLAEGCSRLPPEPTAYWDAEGVDPRRVPDVLAGRPVLVRTVGTADASGFSRALADNGVRTVDADDPDPYLTVVVADDYLNPELDEINRDQRARGHRWMLTKPSGYWTWVGPLFDPDESACWECLRQRLDANRMVEQYLRQFGGVAESSVLSRAGLPTTRAVADALAATEVLRLLVTGRTNLVGRILSLDTRNLEVGSHQVIRLPQCPVCGDPKIMHVDPRVRLEREPVIFSADGGFRSIRPELTFDRLAKHVSRISGAVSWLEPLRTDDTGLAYSYSAGHNFAMVRNNITVLRKNLRGNSGGKGRSDVQAKVSGICEAIERSCGVWSDDRPTLRCRADQLGHRYLLPNELMGFAPEQFADRGTTNARPDNLIHRVPEPFDEQLEIDWTDAWSMTRQETVYVPSAYVWFGHPDCTDHFFTYSDGNGNAAGNTLEEAILQGAFELVERDAVGIWWYNRLPRPGVDLAEFGDPYFDQLVAYYREMGRSLWLLDLTTDLGIPTYAAVSRRLDHSIQDIILAFGSHVDPQLAALRALTEANQFLPAVHGRDSDGNTIYLEEDVATLNWWRTATVDQHPWLLPTPNLTARSTDHPAPQLPTVAGYVEFFVDRAAAAGHEVLVVDQSRPDLELRVAKVMAPGLCHFWRRLGPARLYDLPVRMGALRRPRTYAELNPISVFF